MPDRSELVGAAAAGPGGPRWMARFLGGLSVREVIVKTWQRIDDQAILTRAAAITFYGMAALVPFMGLVIALLAHGLPWIERAFPIYFRLEPVDPIEWLLPGGAVALIKDELSRLRAQAAGGPAVIRTGCTALAVVECFRRDHRRDARDSRAQGHAPFWKRRLIAIVMTLGTAAILILAMLTIVVWPQILKWLGLSQGASIMATLVHMTSVTLTVYVTLALVLQVGSNTAAPWRWISPGCSLGTVVMLSASGLFRLYAQNWADYGATYGSLAGIMLLMSWLWLSSLAMLVAAVVNEVIAEGSDG